MKSIFRHLFSAAALLCAAIPLPAAAQDAAPAAQRAAEQAVAHTTAILAQIDAQIARRTLELNYKTWECYLDYAAEGRITPAIMNYPGLNYRALRDTVPEIDTLGKRLEAAWDAYTEVLKSDAEYESIHDEYVSLKGIKNQELQQANQARYNRMYDRLRKNNAAYEPALARRREAERQRNTAIVGYLLDYHKSIRRAMPTDPLFRQYSDTMRVLRSRCPEIGRMEGELSVLGQIRREIFERQQREAFGVPEQK